MVLVAERLTGMGLAELHRGADVARHDGLRVFPLLADAMVELSDLLARCALELQTSFPGTSVPEKTRIRERSPACPRRSS